MNKNEFIELIEGFENEQFVIVNGGKASSPLTFVKALSDSVQVLSNGKPAIYKYTAIESLSFDISLVSTSSETDDKSDTEVNSMNEEIEYWLKEYETAREKITYDGLALHERRNDVKISVRHTEIAKEWGRIDSMFNDAKKNHSLQQKAARIISELDSIYNKYNCTEIKISSGIVFAELKEYGTAAEEFYKGGDYYNAACCAKLNSDDEFALYCLRCIIKSNEPYDSDVISALFYLLHKYRRGAVCVETFSGLDMSKLDPQIIDILYYGMIMLFGKYDSEFKKAGKPQGDRKTDIEQLLEKIKKFSSDEEIDSVQLTSVPSITDYDAEHYLTSIEKKREADKYQGTITEFNKYDSTGYGFITSKVEKMLYYNIRQVEDDDLRNKLWNGYISKVKVTFTIGIGKDGRKVADHIKACEDLSTLNNICSGMLDSYGNFNKNGDRYGIIIFNEKDYLFRDEAIIDPVLSAYIENSFSVKNIYVKFVSKKLNNNNIALKVWLDDIEEKKIFEEYFPYADKIEYDHFLNQKYEIEHGSYASCPFEYYEMEAWSDDILSKTQVHVDEAKSIHNHFYSQEQSTFYGAGINELLTSGTRYLTKDKDLTKAESCFLAVLERNPGRSHINTAVSNLITIYKQKEPKEAFNILEKYHGVIEQDKYNNHLIDILDKTKSYNELIELLITVIPNAGKSQPHRIKQLITCYIKTNKPQDAINSLKKYKNSIDELSYNNLYISALELSGNFSETEKFMNNLISKTYRVEHKLNYMGKLAVVYQKNEKPKEAINIYEQWKKFYSANRSNITTSTAVAAVSKLEITVDRNLCVLYYTSNKVEEAKALARNLLRKNSEDNIAQHILDDSYVSPENHIVSISDYDDEHTYFETSDDSVPKLLEYMLNNVDYEREFFSQSILNNIGENGRYVGDENQAKSDIENILEHISNKSFLAQSTIFMALAKIIKHFVEIGQRDKYFTQKKLNLFLGRSLLFKADADIQRNHQNIDCLRYYYFLSLRYLSRSGDSTNLYHAINMLYNSFFLSDNELSDTVVKNDFNEELRVSPPKYQDSILSVNELMTCTFDLDINYHQSKLGEMKIVRKIIDEIFKNDTLNEKIANCLSLLISYDGSDFSFEYKSSDEFFTIWKKARDKYNKRKNDLSKYMHDAAEYINEPEKLNNYLNKIGKLKTEQILSKTDSDYLYNILDILTEFNKVNELIIIEDRADTLDKVIDECETLEKRICETPTDFSYEKMLDIIINLRGKANKLKNDLYSESEPNLNVYPEDTVFYKNDHNQTTITIYVENKGNVQKADISNIVISGKDNHIEIMGNPEHTVTTVHGNKKVDYTVDISFTNEEKERKLFDIIFSFDYSYYDGSGEQVKQHVNEVFQINLSSMESFVKIDNKYSSLCESGAVESDEMFFGREMEIESIVSSLDQGDGKVLSHRGIYMYGQKRAGKSSIMAHLAKRINERYPGRYIIIDLGSIGASIEAGYEVWLKTSLLSKLEDELDEKYSGVYHEIEKIFSFNDVIKRIEDYPDTSDFDKLLDKIEKLIPDTVIMIFVDEFTYIYESIKKKQCSDTFPHFWKALLQNHNICSIIIGQDSMINFAEDYANDFACMQKKFVSYLEEEGAKKLISEPITDNGQNRFEEDALDLIYQLTAGSAYLIMIICSQLVDYMNERGTSRVTKNTVETFVKKWLFNTAKNSNSIDDNIFDPQLNDPCFFENASQVCSDNKVILTYIANQCNLNNQIKVTDINCIHQLSEKSAEYQNKLIDQLIKRKVLIKEGEYCRIWVDLLRRYLKV